MNDKNNLLLILDGWGYRQDSNYNAISQAKTPNWDKLLQEYPHRLLNASGLFVGLPDGQMGNSEVGHINLGAGRIVYQMLTEINIDVENNNLGGEVLNKVLNKCKDSKGALHIWGLLSDGGIHSHIDHIHSLVKKASEYNIDKIYIHAFLDGRDTPPSSAEKYLQSTEGLIVSLNEKRREGQVLMISSIIGRYYAMDRDNRWERVEKAYNLLVNGEGQFYASNSIDALEMAYGRSETDEFIQSTSIGEKVKLLEGDSVVFMNFRSDRARQLTKIFVDPKFDRLKKIHPNLNQFVTLTPYLDDFNIESLYKVKFVDNSLGEYLSKLSKTQLRIAETEKYPHVSFFFSCGKEETFPGESRILVDSPKVATYDLKPEMSLYEVTDNLVDAIASKAYNMIICNFANADMVGHTGSMEAAVVAAEAVDKSLEKVLNALDTNGGQALICADHGNFENMWDFKNEVPHTAHTTNYVPLVYFGSKSIEFSDEEASISNVAPTLLDIMSLAIPKEMTSHSLIKK